MKHGLAFTTAYHTCFPEYVKPRFGVPLAWTYAWLKRFHGPSSGVLVSTPAIRSELELADSQWLFFDAALRRPADDAGLNAVATTSERLLGVMDKLTSLYEAALREVLG